MVTKDASAPARQFLGGISAWEDGYSNAGFSYHARRTEDGLLILHGRVFLHAWKDRLPTAQVYFSDQEVGHFPFSSFGLGLREFIDKVRAGEWITGPNGRMRLFPSVGGNIQEKLDEHHQSGLQNGHRFALLSIQGGQFDESRMSPATDWHLKASATPYDSMWELLNEFHLAGYTEEFAAMEFLAFQVAEIDMGSVVEGEVAHPRVFLSKGLDPAKCRIGYRIHTPEGVLARGTIGYGQIQWSDIGHPDLGECMQGMGTLSIPSAAGVHCFATYADCAQHQYWIGDPSNFPNWRRAVYEEFDSGCSELRDQLFSEKKHRQEGSRILERGVAWLLWLLGFAPIRLDLKRTESGPDLIAITPGNRMAIVECTVDVIDSEKLAKLVSRSKAIATRLQASSASHVGLMPILVTPRIRAELVEIEKIAELGVAVFAREDLEAALNRSIIFQNADDFFQQVALSLKQH